MVLVYRVEHTIFGMGPYQVRRFSDAPARLFDFAVEMCEAHSWYSGEGEDPWPSTREDGMERDEADYCGFESIERMREWFAGYGERLSAQGFVVNLYAVPGDYLQRGTTRRQVLFQKEHASLVRTVPVTTLIR